MRDFIEQTNAAKTHEELFDILLKHAERLGFPRIAYGCIKGDFEKVRENLPSPAITLNYPDFWVSHYFESGYMTVDPVVVQSPKRLEAFEWQVAARSPYGNSLEQQIVNEANEAGLHKGISVPLHGPGGDCFVLSFAMSDKDSVPKDIKSMLSLVAYQFHVSFLHQIGAQYSIEGELSEQALEILKWAAQGKTQAEISDILRISHDGVKYHIEQIRKKLKTNNLANSIYEAMRRGFIS